VSNNQYIAIRNLKVRRDTLSEALEEGFSKDLYEELLWVEVQLEEELSLVQ
jgi:hypothetical protein